jgi:hypothetical protein
VIHVDNFLLPDLSRNNIPKPSLASMKMVVKIMILKN